MPLRIADPQVVAKVERLSRLTGLGKAAAVEAALDRMLAEVGPEPAPQAKADPWHGIDEIVARLHRLNPRPDPFEAVEYDEKGLPK
jgi:antitoxin VapB